MQEGGGGMTAKLVWTNPDPTAYFSAQTISLDLSDAKYVIIKYTPNYQQPTYFYESIIDLSISNKIALGSPNRIYNDGSVNMINCYARYGTVSSSGITFTVAYYSTNTTGNCSIPYQIYKITDDITFES